MSNLADSNAYYEYYDYESLMEAARRHAARGDLEQAELYAEAAYDVLEMEAGEVNE